MSGYSRSQPFLGSGCHTGRNPSATRDEHHILPLPASIAEEGGIEKLHQRLPSPLRVFLFILSTLLAQFCSLKTNIPVRVSDLVCLKEYTIIRLRPYDESFPASRFFFLGMLIWTDDLFSYIDTTDGVMLIFLVRENSISSRSTEYRGGLPGLPIPQFPSPLGPFSYLDRHHRRSDCQVDNPGSLPSDVSLNDESKLLREYP